MKTIKDRVPIVVTSLLAAAAFMVALLALLAPGAAAASQQDAPASRATFPVFADFEGGFPPDWFQYGDGGVTIDAIIDTVADTDPNAVPGQIGDNAVLSATVNVPTWGGFGAALNPVQNWSDYDAVSFWFYGENSGAEHEFELQTAPGDDRRATFVDSFTGWRQIILPFATFGAGGAYDVSQVDNWVFVLDGTVGSLKLDDLQLVNLMPFADFEGGFPPDWFQYGDGGVTLDLAVDTVADTDPDAVPGQVGDNDVLSATVNVPTFGGFGAAFNPVQDWTDMQGVGFWFYGENSGAEHEFEIQTASSDDRRATFVDDFSGWRYMTLPFVSFGTLPYDVSQVDNWVFVLDGTVGSLKLDSVAVYGDAGSVTRRVAFENSTYEVMEGGTATITATLNVTSTTPVTVSYATSDGTATAGVDYTAASGTLIFPAGESSQTFTVDTIDNGDNDDERTVVLTLSDPANAELGAPNPASLIIGDDEMDTPSGKAVIIEDFEDGLLPMGQDPDGNAVGYSFFAGGSSTVTLSITDTLPAPVPGSTPGNKALSEYLFVTSGSFAGYLYSFTNDSVDAWVAQNWLPYEGIGFWLYGNNSGGVIFIDVLDNRSPGSTTDDAERWSIDIADDFSGWQYFEFTWDEFNRKDVGNGAPNDGFNLTEIHGYAFGGFGSSPMDHTYFIDDVRLLQRVTMVDDFEQGTLPAGTDPNGIDVGYVTFAGGGGGVSITTTNTPPAPVPGAAPANLVLQGTMTLPPGAFAGFVHNFTNDTVDAWVPADWSGYEGICFWVYGHNTGGVLFLDILDNRNPGSTVDDAERWSVDIADDFTGWQFFQFTWDEFSRKEIGNGAPNDGFNLTEIHGYALGGFGSVDMGTNDYYVDDFAIWGNSGADIPLEAQFAANAVEVTEGATAQISVTLNMTATEPVTVTYATAESVAVPDRDFVPTSGSVMIPAGDLAASFPVETIDDEKHNRSRNLMVVLYDAANAQLGFQRQVVLNILDNDPVDPALLDDFEGFHPFLVDGGADVQVIELADGDANALPGQGAYEQVAQVTGSGPATLERTFVEPQDWTSHGGFSFWFYGSGSGETYTVQLYDNKSTTTADTPPSQWELVWADEFNDPAGTPPDPNIWGYEIGDGSLNGIPGWGNAEFQFYTDDPANASTDGAGNLVIVLDEVMTGTTDLVCYYGPCRYTSARLATKYRAEFEYGRIEARVQVPPGEDGLWPAFWSLGTDIDDVGWPQTGEIDIMEYVSRIPTEIFGTIHGPGYSGGSAYGDTYDFGQPVSDDYHTFSVEWSPDEIQWFVDGINYHSAVPGDVAPDEWVFNHPFYLLLNVAIGGNFGGSISPDLTFPQETFVDYVRVYQAADTAERFETTFTDDFSGWQLVTVPFGDLVRSADQPAGAPDDGLGLNEVWGYALILPGGGPARGNGSFLIDQVRLGDGIPTSVAVTAAGGDSALPRGMLPLLLVVVALVLVYPIWRLRRRVWRVDEPL